MKKFLSAGIITLLIIGCAGEPEPEPEPIPGVPEGAYRPRPAPQPDTDEQEVRFQRENTVEIPIPPETAEGSAGVEVWYRIDGGGWFNHGLVPSTSSSARFLAPRDGRYDFVLVPISLQNEPLFIPGETTLAGAIFVIDSTGPVVEVLAPNGGEMFRAGETTLIRWTALDVNTAPKSVCIDVSSNGGAVWVPVARDLPNTGSYHWDIPTTTSEAYRLRVSMVDSAGNATLDESDGLFIVDALPPEVRIIGPASANEVPVPIRYHAKDLGGAGVDRIELYVSRDGGGKSWELVGETLKPGEPIEFSELDGIYGFTAVGVDRLGNRGPIPTPGTRPAFVLWLDRTAPEVHVFEPGKDTFAIANHETPITWVAKDNLKMADNGITLEYSPDDGKTWQLIEDNVLNSGRYELWKPPPIGTEVFLVRVRARDLHGNAGAAVSHRFAVDVGAPQGVITEIKKEEFALRVDYEKARGRTHAVVDRVELWYTDMSDPERKWWLYGTDDDQDGTTWFRKRDGEYGLALVVSTAPARAFGLAQKPPGNGDEPQRRVVVDFTPPVVTLLEPKHEISLPAGAMKEIKWSYHDENPDPNGLDIEISRDKGKTWASLAANSLGLDPRDGRYVWTVPRESGSFIIRVKARDAQGNVKPDRSDPFRIDSHPPDVRITQDMPRYIKSRELLVPYQARDDVGIIKEVRVLVRREKSEVFRVFDRSIDPVGTFKLKFLADDTYDVVLVAADDSGRGAADQAPIEKPHFRVTVDTQKPLVKLETFDGADRRKHWARDYTVFWTAEDVGTDPAELFVTIAYRVDGDPKWWTAARDLPNRGRFSLLSFLERGRRYRVRVVVRDPAGNDNSAETGSFRSDELPLPKIWLDGVENGQMFMVGVHHRVGWNSSDPGIEYAGLEFSRQGGPFMHVDSGRKEDGFKVEMPEKEGEYAMRVTATDSMGNSIESPQISFQILPVDDVPLRIVTQFVNGATLRPGSQHKIVWQPVDIVKAAETVELQYLGRKAKWITIQEIKGSVDAIMTAPLDEGEYAVRLLAKFKGGREIQSDAVLFVVVEDVPAPRLELTTFRGGGYYAGGTGRVIGLKAENVDLTKVWVEYSADGGVNWTKVHEGELVAIGGGVYWRKLPSQKGEGYRVRVSFEREGRRAEAESERDFTIDTAPPRASVSGPLEGEAPVLLRAHTVRSLAPIERLTLWMTEDGGITWTTVSGAGPGDTIEFSPQRTGKYGLFLSAQSLAGLSSVTPRRGTKPQHVIQVGKTAEHVEPPRGKITLSVRLTKKIYKGGQKVVIHWEAEDPPLGGRVLVELVVKEQARIEIEDTDSLVGKLEWQLPEVDSTYCYIEAKLLLRGKEVDADGSRAFEIDSSPPIPEKFEYVPIKE
ncbi:MAG: GPI anchored serine-threonine rich family protein [Planctomycetota bacterium]|jgi:hypothetical protein